MIDLPTQTEYIFNQISLPQAIVIKSTTMVEGDMVSQIISKLVIKNCNGKNYSFDKADFPKLNGQIFGTISISFLTDDKCNLNNLKIGFYTNYKDNNVDKLIFNIIKFKNNVPQLIMEDRYNSHIDWAN